MAKKKLKFKELNRNGLFIFVFTLAGYLFTFLFKSAFLSYYRLPVEFLKIDIVDLAYAGVFSVIFGIFLFASLISDKMKVDNSFKGHLRKQIIPDIFLSLYALGYLIIFTDIIKTPFYLLLLLLCIAVMIILFSLIGALLSLIDYKNKTYEKEKKDIKKSANTSRMIIAMVALTFILLIGYYLGYYVAFIKRNYLIIEGEPKLVAVAEYKDGFLTAPIDGDTIKAEYTYIEIENGTVFSIEDIGRLKILD